MHFSKQRIYLMNFIFIDNELKNPEQNDYHELIIFFFYKFNLFMWKIREINRDNDNFVIWKWKFFIYVQYEYKNDDKNCKLC